MMLRRLPLLWLLTAAGAAQAADLVETYRLASEHDAVIAAARASHRAGLERLPQGLAGLLPQVSLTADTTHRDVETPASRTQGNSHGYSVSLSQPVYRAQNLAQYAQAKHQVEQAEAQLAAAEQDLILRVAQAYFDVLLAENNLTLAGAQKAAIAEQLELAKRSFEVGTTTITDTHEAQARHDLTLAQEIAAANDLDVKRRALEQLIGRLPPALSALRADFDPAAPTPADMPHWVDLAEQANPSLRVQAAARKVADEQVARNRGEHLPTLDLVASYRDANDISTFGRTESQTASVGLQLNVPLFQGGGTQSRVREALANRDRARQDEENARRQAGLAARQAYLGVTSGIAQVKALEAALRSSQSQLESTRLGQEVGVRTGVDVLNAQQQLYAARRDLAQARYATLLNQLRLEAAAGQLDPADVERVNAGLAR